MQARITAGTVDHSRARTATSSPTRAGTSTGPNDRKKLNKGRLRDAPSTPNSSAPPAPSTIPLKTHQPTATATGTAAAPGSSTFESRKPGRTAAFSVIERPQTSAKTPPTKGLIIVAPPSASPDRTIAASVASDPA